MPTDYTGKKTDLKRYYTDTMHACFMHVQLPWYYARKEMLQEECLTFLFTTNTSPSSKRHLWEPPRSAAGQGEKHAARQWTGNAHAISRPSRISLPIYVAATPSEGLCRLPGPCAAAVPSTSAKYKSGSAKKLKTSYVRLKTNRKPYSSSTAIWFGLSVSGAADAETPRSIGRWFMPPQSLQRLSPRKRAFVVSGLRPAAMERRMSLPGFGLAAASTIRPDWPRPWPSARRSAAPGRKPSAPAGPVAGHGPDGLRHPGFRFARSGMLSRHGRRAARLSADETGGERAAHCSSHCWQQLRPGCCRPLPLQKDSADGFATHLAMHMGTHQGKSLDGTWPREASKPTIWKHKPTTSANTSLTALMPGLADDVKAPLQRIPRLWTDFGLAGLLAAAAVIALLHRAWRRHPYGSSLHCRTLPCPWASSLYFLSFPLSTHMDVHRIVCCSVAPAYPPDSRLRRTIAVPAAFGLCPLSAFALRRMQAEIQWCGQVNCSLCGQTEQMLPIYAKLYTEMKDEPPFPL